MEGEDVGVLAQGTRGSREVEVVQSLPSLTSMRVHVHTSPRSKSDFQICGSRAGFVRLGLVGQEVCCKDVVKLGGKLRPQAGRVWGRSLRRGRGAGSCDCPLSLFVHPVSGLAGQVSLGLQTGLPEAGP